MVLQTMILNVSDLCESGAWYGKIGTQSNEEPYEWVGFQMPQKVEVSIKSIDMGYDIWIQITEEKLMKGASITLNIGNTQKTFDIEDSKVDDSGIIQNYIKIYSHTFLGIEEDVILENFLAETMRILGSSWAGKNRIKACNALKNAIIKSPNKYFETHHPELII